MLERLKGKPAPDIYQEVRQIGAEGAAQIGAAGPEPGSPGVKTAEGSPGNLITSEAGSMTLVPSEGSDVGIGTGMAVHAKSAGSVQGEDATDARYRTAVMSKADAPLYKSPAHVGETTVTRRVTARDQVTRAEFRNRYGRQPGEYTHEFGDKTKEKAAKLMAGMVIKQAQRDVPLEEQKKAA
jgi:hypothetical protein